MKRPPKRRDIPPRNSENRKKRLAEIVTDEHVAALLPTVKYGGSSKHKRNPAIFDLPPFNGSRGDATLCDEHAKFMPADMGRIPRLIERGLKAKLIGTNLWTIDDNGWIYEASVTNEVMSEYHGYPVRPTDAIAEPVFRRFNEWAAAHGNAIDKQAAHNCAALYGFS